MNAYMNGGSMLVTFDDDDTFLWRIMERSIEQAIPGLKIISGTLARELEPTLPEGVKHALIFPESSSGILQVA
jgi:L-2-hydroxyglutarate oxidase LhgO